MVSATNTLGKMICDAASIFRPPERMTVAEAAFKYVHLKNPPTYEGPYLPDKTPYMIEPQNMTQSRHHKSVVFCGPSQTGKTEGIINNTIAYHIKCNPMDLILYAPSQSASRDFSKRRIDRMLRNSKKIGMELVPGQHADNTHDKTFKTGMILSISWPSINEMSSKPIPVVMFTEYDRMPDDVEGEGSPFMLGQKRSTSFRNLGMTVVDSSPAKEVTNPRAKVIGHMAPPCNGILGLYNEGDRRRWYWPCPHCGEFFTASFANLVYDTHRGEDDDEVRLPYSEVAKTVYMACPNNGCRIEPQHKHDMNLRGVWLRDGEKITAAGLRYGDPLESDSATYWLLGPAAEYTTWQDLVVKYLKAMRKLEDTGDDNDLKTTINTDQGEPYIPKQDSDGRLAEDIMETAEDVPLGIVPEIVRALFALVDVQKNMFVVQVVGVVPGKPYEAAVVDRFNIVKSERLDEDGERLWVKPGSELSDWELLKAQVMEKRYPLITGNGTMGVSMTFCDSGGKEGVTTNAYNFWRKLRDEGHGAKFQLVKGEPKANAPRVRLGHPDSQRKDRHAAARGEIPVLFINSTMVRDYVDDMLTIERDKEGFVSSPSKVHFPSGLSLEFYEELTAEVKVNGKWVKVRQRNETWDLLAYFVAACTWRRVEQVDWKKPPPWLAEWKDNPNVELTRDGKPVQVDNKQERGRSLADLGALLA